MVNLAHSIYGFDHLATYRQRIQGKKSFGHPAVVFALAGHQLQVDQETTILYYLYTTMVELVQNAVRAIPLGQTDGQRIIYEFQKDLEDVTNKIMTLDEADFGLVSPGLELGQMQHERIQFRVFSS